MIDDACPQARRAAILVYDIDRNEHRHWRTAPRGDLRGYRSPLQQQQRPDYLKLILLLAMIFLPWVAIGYVAWLVSTSP
jgi:hypothetical protein